MSHTPLQVRVVLGEHIKFSITFSVASVELKTHSSESISAHSMKRMYILFVKDRKMNSIQKRRHDAK